jgi:hypothetical protein
MFRNASDADEYEDAIEHGERQCVTKKPLFLYSPENAVERERLTSPTD